MCCLFFALHWHLFNIKQRKKTKSSKLFSFINIDSVLNFNLLPFDFLLGVQCRSVGRLGDRKRMRIHKSYFT